MTSAITVRMRPTISDADYDALRQRNAAIEDRFPELVLAETPSKRVGAAPQEKFGKVQAPGADAVARQCLCRRGCRGFPGARAAVPEFAGGRRKSRSPPSPRSTGCRSRCATRTASWCRRPRAAMARRARMSPPMCAPFRDVPAKLPHGRCPAVLEVRGEIYMSHKDFAALNEKQAAGGREDLRQSAQRRGGSLRQLDPSITAARPLRFFAYAWGEAPDAASGNPVGRGRRASSAWGFPVNPLMKLCRSAEELLAHYRSIEARRADLGYDIDGVVYKVNRLDWQERLGFVSRSPALGHRAQVRGRAGHDGSGRHRHPGRAHRRADAGGAAAAGHGRRRRRLQRHAAQRGRNRPQGYARSATR